MKSDKTNKPKPNHKPLSEEELNRQMSAGLAKRIRPNAHLKEAADRISRKLGMK